MITQGSTDFMAANGVSLVSANAETDPVTGIQWVQIYEGRAAGLQALSLELTRFGAKTSASYQGGKSTLRVAWGRDPSISPSSEVPVDRWEINRDTYQISVFSHPRAKNEAKKYESQKDKKRGSYKLEIEAAVSAPADYPLDEKTFPFGKVIFRGLTQGVEYWETTRPALHRTRSYTQTYTGEPQKLTPIDTVFTRDSLIAAYGIPEDVQKLIPLDPDEPPDEGCFWGWRLRVQTGAYEPAKRRIEEHTEWDYASWEADNTPFKSLYLLV